jgi:hypothetical protein
VRPLLIDEQAKADVARVREWAEQPVHFYRPGIDSTVPGDLPEFRCFLHHGFRCVYTITESNGVRYRQLSISVTGDNYPNPIAAYTIAHLFGFTGWDGKSDQPPESWMGAVNQKEHCVVLAQPLPEGASA